MPNVDIKSLPPDRRVRLLGGRARYNAQRRQRMLLRRKKVFRMKWIEGKTKRQMAEELGVGMTTIDRDIAAIRQELREKNRCPTCGRPLGLQRRDDIWEK